jgi:hypothetical protein
MTEKLLLQPLTMEADSTADALTYTFKGMRAASPLGLFPIFKLVFFVGLPAVAAGLAVCALASGGLEVPWYQASAAALGTLQMSVLFVIGALDSTVSALLGCLFAHCGRHELAFDAHEMHYGSRVGGVRLGDRLPLGSIRQVIVYAYPDTTEPGAAATQADLAIGVGGDKRRYALLSGFDREAVEAFARDIDRRLAELLSRLGTRHALDPVEVIETTAKEANQLRHTLPRVPPRSWARLQWLLRRALFALAENKALAVAWGMLLAAGTAATIPLLYRNGLAWGIPVLLLNAFVQAVPVWIAFAVRSPPS